MSETVAGLFRREAGTKRASANAGKFRQVARLQFTFNTKQNKMNTEQKLKAIRDKCVERIAYAESNVSDLYGGDAISGWKATIAAIDNVIELKKDIDCGWKTMCIKLGIKDPDEERDVWPKPATDIIKAWEGLV